MVSAPAALPPQQAGRKSSQSENFHLSQADMSHASAKVRRSTRPSSEQSRVSQLHTRLLGHHPPRPHQRVQLAAPETLGISGRQGSALPALGGVPGRPGMARTNVQGEGSPPGALQQVWGGRGPPFPKSRHRTDPGPPAVGTEMPGNQVNMEREGWGGGDMACRHGLRHSSSACPQHPWGASGSYHGLLARPTLGMEARLGQCFVAGTVVWTPGGLTPGGLTRDMLQIPDPDSPVLGARLLVLEPSLAGHHRKTPRF